jgi:1-acyl-sn-glycerol-3-phosphate acyltransferase
MSSMPHQPEPTTRFVYRVSRFICQILFIYVFRGRAFGIRNVPRHGGALLVCNHQSFLDPMLATLGLPRECNYMARDSLFHHPIFRRVIQAYNAYPVRRDSADMGAIKETLRRLKDGKIVTAFPEGTRTEDGRIGPMRAGVVLLARKTKVPIVPVVVLGAFESWPRSARFPRPRPVLVAYDKPMYPHEHPEWSDDECVERVRGRILALKARYEGYPSLHLRRSSREAQ